MMQAEVAVAAIEVQQVVGTADTCVRMGAQHAVQQQAGLAENTIDDGHTSKETEAITVAAGVGF